MGYAVSLIAALVLAGCVYTETHSPDGTVERKIGPGVIVVGSLKEGARQTQMLGAAWTGSAAIVGWAKISEARLGECGVAIVPALEFEANARMLGGMKC